MTGVHTLFLRLEGPLQAWGDTSKFVIRRTMEAPTKSGVIGLICCALGLPRQAAREKLPELNTLSMGVRVDRPGIRWWDYHTVGAGIGLTTAGGGVKTGAQGTIITRREYLADASFLVALQGEETLVREIARALANPRWPLFLGRRSCPPSVPILVTRMRADGTRAPWIEHGKSLEDALMCVPWAPHLKQDKQPAELACILDWQPTDAKPEAPPNAEVWYDVPVAFDPPVHQARFVTRETLTLGENGVPTGEHTQTRVPRPERTRADYTNTEWKKRRAARLERDHGLCVFCKAQANTVQHISYRNAGGNEDIEKDLASLCRLCHDACTMLEYGLGMGIDRIDPKDPKWRDRIIEKRAEIRCFRSVEGRSRMLARAPGQDKKALEELDAEEE